jgi:hypothetical protein
MAGIVVAAVDGCLEVFHCGGVGNCNWEPNMLLGKIEVNCYNRILSPGGIWSSCSRPEERGRSARCCHGVAVGIRVELRVGTEGVLINCKGGLSGDRPVSGLPGESHAKYMLLGKREPVGLAKIYGAVL